VRKPVSAVVLKRRSADLLFNDPRLLVGGLALAIRKNAASIGGTSRWRRPDLYDRFLFVTVNDLPGRARLQGGNFPRPAKSRPRRRKNHGFAIIAWMLVGKAADHWPAGPRYDAGHGCGRGHERPNGAAYLWQRRLCQKPISNEARGTAPISP